MNLYSYAMILERYQYGVGQSTLRAGALTAASESAAKGSVIEVLENSGDLKEWGLRNIQVVMIGDESVAQPFADLHSKKDGE
ncbi:hypothetical protein ACUN8C_05780 [Kushneria sp. Sum13]|uniref:hypothetical protein n=1 Tax=Kushneria sp. Sum13 TaxID=3459196 RepID=UPI0040459746